MMIDLSPTEKHIILSKLVYLLDRVPDAKDLAKPETRSTVRQWVSNVRALLNRHDPLSLVISFNMKLERFSYGYNYSYYAFNDIVGLITDTIEAIKLDLELDGRTDIGTAYNPGEAYRYFADLKQIISGAKEEILLVDPFLDGRTFDACFSDSPEEISIRILTKQYTNEITEYADRHGLQFKSTVEIRKSNELHDRLIMTDRDDCWISGASFKDGGTKTTYLVPLTPPIPEDKLRIYNEIWEQADPSYKNQLKT